MQKNLNNRARIFKLKVKEFEPEKRLTWGDATGNRVCTINNKLNGTVQFSMIKKIGGPLFPLFAKIIPSFDEAFERFAANLKKEVEIIANK